jgi:hypothetical protein
MSTRASSSSSKKRQPPPPDPEDLLSDEDLEDEDLEDEDDLDFIDPSMLLQSLLSTEDGSDTICTALVKIHAQLEVHNKIMVKLLSHLTTTSAAAKKVAEEKSS